MGYTCSMTVQLPSTFVLGNPRENEKDLARLLELAERTALIRADQEGGSDPDPLKTLLLINQFLGARVLEVCDILSRAGGVAHFKKNIISCGKWHVFLDTSLQCLGYESWEDFALRETCGSSSPGQDLIIMLGPNIHRILLDDAKISFSHALANAWTQMQAGELGRGTPRMRSNQPVKRF